MSRQQAEWVVRRRQKRDLLIDAATSVSVVGLWLFLSPHVPSRPMQRRHVAVVADLAAVVAVEIVVVVVAFVAVV